MRQYDESQNNQQLSFSERMGLIGAALTAVGDTLVLIATAAAIEENRESEQKQQQKIDDLQNQINEIKQDTKSKDLQERIVVLLEKMEAADEAVDNGTFGGKKSSNR